MSSLIVLSEKVLTSIAAIAYVESEEIKKSESFPTKLELFSWKSTSHKDHLEVCLPLVDFYLVSMGCGLP